MEARRREDTVMGENHRELTTTPTPAHQAFREKRADEIYPELDSEGLYDRFSSSRREGFLAGAEAEFDVAWLMGAVHALTGLDGQEEELERMRGLLAALLEGK